MKTFSVVFYVQAENLREAKRAAKSTFEFGYGRGELEAELIAGLREEKPPRAKSTKKGAQ